LLCGEEGKDESMLTVDSSKDGHKGQTVSRTVLRLVAPFLLTVYPILHLYITNRGQATPDMLVWPLGLAIIGTAAVFGVASLVLRDASRAALLSAVCVVAFYGFGHLFAVVYQWTAPILAPPRPTVNPATYELQLQHTLTVLTAAGILLGIWVIRRLKAEPARVASVVVATIAWALVVQVAVSAGLSAPPTPDTPHAVTRPAAPTTSSPDIYQIVLDGYGRQDVLREHFDFDNEPFIQALERMGFMVPRRSRANFYWTVLSLSSLLNLRYVTDLETRVGRQETDRSLPIRWIRDNEVGRLLRAKGYTTVHLNSTWVGTMENPFADVEIPCAAGWSQNQFYRGLAENSLLRIFRSRMTTDLAACHLSQLRALVDTTARPGPKFVFAHFIPPHHPYLFDRNGRILKHATIADEPSFNRRLWGRRDLYRDQVAFVNRRILDVVKVILERATRPTVILLHSDHGPHLVGADGEFEKGGERARFANFVAVYGLGVPDDLELVNLYRLVFNRYFGTQYPLLAGAQYASPFSYPFAFERIALKDK
jgi:hypothetical protein